MSPIPPRSPMTPILDPEVRNRINAELQPGERLLWAGQPTPALYARSSRPIMVFGLFFTGFSLFWIAAAGGMMWFADGPGSRDRGFQVFNCFPLFGIPFFLVGMGMVTSPIWMRRAAKRTVYGVTDRRCIVVKGKPTGGVEVRSFGPGDLTDMSRNEYANGGGDLVFQEDFRMSTNSKGHTTSTRTAHGFIGIENVRDIENLIRSQVLAPHETRGRGED